MADPARNLEPEQPRDNVEYLPGASPLSGDELGGEADPNGNVIDASNLIRERDGMSDQVDQSGQPQPTIGDRVQDAQNQYEQGKEKANRLRDWYQGLKDKRAAKKALRSGAKEAGKKGLQGVEQETVKKAGRKVATRGAEELGEVAVKTGVEATAKVGATLAGEAAAGPVGWAAAAVTILTSLKSLWPVIKKALPKIVLILSFLGILPAIIFSLLAGKGFSILPTTEAQQNQTLVAGYASGDALSTRQVTAEFVKQEKLRYQNILNAARSKYPDQVKSAQVKVDELNSLTEQIIVLSGDQRKTMIQTALDKRDSLIKAHPDIFLSGGTCADTAKYIADKSITIRASSDAELLPNGQLKNISGQVITANPKLCNIIVYLVKNGYKIGALTLSNNHSRFVKNTDRTSEHYLGRAVDIAIINGSSYGKPNWVSNSTAVMQLLRDNKDALGVWDSWGPSGLSIDNGKFTPKRIGGHDNHIHLSVR